MPGCREASEVGLPFGFLITAELVQQRPSVESGIMAVKDKLYTIVPDWLDIDNLNILFASL